MLLIRDIMYCKPGKVRQLVEKFKAMDRIGKRLGFPHMRITTDVSAERYWTLVSEMEVESFDALQKMMSGDGQDPAALKELEEAMKGYHDLVDSGRREVYNVEN